MQYLYIMRCNTSLLRSNTVSHLHKNKDDFMKIIFSACSHWGEHQARGRRKKMVVNLWQDEGIRLCLRKANFQTNFFLAMTSRRSTYIYSASSSRDKLKKHLYIQCILFERQAEEMFSSPLTTRSQTFHPFTIILLHYTGLLHPEEAKLWMPFQHLKLHR